MEIPTTTAEKPYIEFRIDKNDKLTLSATSEWWGGKKAGFISSDGSEGNTCEPAKLQEYIESYYARKIKNTEKQIASRQKKIKKMLLEVKNLKKKYGTTFNVSQPTKKQIHKWCKNKTR